MNYQRIVSPVLFVFLATFALFSQQSQVKPGVTSQTVKPSTAAPAATKNPELRPVTSAAVGAEAKIDYFVAPDAEAYSPKPVDTATAPTVIAFGSCNKMQMPQTHWSGVAANNPNLWIWLGDIIYADTTDMSALAKHYRRLKTNPDYKLLRTKAQVIGVYDDHDYGVNDGCKNYPKRKESKKCLMDFLDVPKNSPLRKQEGAYQSYTFGKGAQTIKVIVMDTRYFRDPLTPDSTKHRRYLPNLEGTVLGEAQWRWLEQELRNSRANLNILCSSVQVIADEHGYEKWGNFPNERKRLLQLISTVKPKNLLILSGDRHMAEISKMNLAGLPYPLYDFTSSGLTHIRAGLIETNKNRVGDMIVKKNFGLLKIRWEGEKPVVAMQIHATNNEMLQEIIARY